MSRDKRDDEIEVTLEMVDAGAKVLMEKMEEGPYWSRHVAAEVFAVMLAAGGWPSFFRQIGLPAERDRETSKRTPL